MADKNSSTEAVAHAKAAVDAMAEQYIGWVTADLARLDAAFAALPAAPTGIAAEAAYRDVHGVAHDIKGQGSTFGYILVTDIASLLCHYLERGMKGEALDGNAIAHHIDALKTVVDNRIKGDGGELGGEVIAALKAVVE